MRYSRVLAVVTLMAAVGLAAVALGRSSQAPAPGQLHREVHQLVQQFLAVQRHVVAPPPLEGALPAPPIAGATCFVATSCSIKPCVVPVANAVSLTVPPPANAVPAPPAVVPVPAVPHAAAAGCPRGDREPRSVPVSIPALSAHPR